MKHRFIYLFIILIIFLNIPVSAQENNHAHIYKDYVENHDATCILDGTKTGKCTECESFETVLVDNSALGCDLEANWTINEDTHFAELMLVCKSNPEHIFTSTVPYNEEIIEEPTCSKEGKKRIYTSLIFNGVKYEYDEEVNIEKTKCEWICGGWKWNDDYTEASVTFTCANNLEHFKEVTTTEIETPSLSRICVESQDETFENYKKATVEFEGIIYNKTVNLNFSGNHNMSKLSVVKYPTCTEKGIKSIYCRDCDYIEYSEEIPATGHSFTAEWNLDDPENPTCVLSCANCDSKFIIEKENINISEGTLYNYGCENAKKITKYQTTFEGSPFVYATEEEVKAEHIFYGYEKSTLQHARMCEHCGYVEKGTHIDNDLDGVCDVCDYVFEIKGQDNEPGVEGDVTPLLGENKKARVTAWCLLFASLIYVFYYFIIYKDIIYYNVILKLKGK